MLVVFFLPFVATQFVWGDLSTHFAVELRAEERHAKAQFKRDPLIFRWKGWKKRIVRGQGEMGNPTWDRCHILSSSLCILQNLFQMIT